MLKIDTALLVTVQAIWIPVIIALLVKAHAPSWLKAVISVVLSFFAALVAQAIAIGGLIPNWKTFLIAALLAFVTQRTTYAGLLKQLGLDQQPTSANLLTLPLGVQNFGLGKKTAAKHTKKAA